MARLRAEPPSSVGGIRVERIDDLVDGFGALPPSDVLRILLEDGGRVMVRPSGTEPKLKVYIDAVVDEGTVAERRAAASAAVAALDAGMRELGLTLARQLELRPDAGPQAGLTELTA